jgi:serine/threonine-protein kinase
MLDAPKTPHFTTGLFRGYFDGTPPIEFFQTYAFYVYSSILPGIYELDLTDTDEVNRMLMQTQDVLGWFEDIDNPVPKWYLKDFYIQWTDGVSYKLKEPFDFSFLSEYGKVFRVFDNSYSGVICFGVEKSGKRYFLKFAGAKTFDATCQNIEDIVMMLKISVPKYKHLKHPLLINQIGAEEVGGGFITVYDWFDGEGCGYMHPETQERFLALPNEDKLRVYEGILDFHAHVIECGYIAIDFNNGSTLYNFITGDFAFCDIDFYAKHSQISGWSGIWGDPSLKSPEECRGYSVITEVSNVYTMGAVAFYLFASDDKALCEKWTLSEKQYKVAKKAISEKRSERQQTIQQFITEWRAAK